MRFAERAVDASALVVHPVDVVASDALLVALRREDIVLPGDLALRRAIRNAYQLERLPDEQEVLAIAEKWRPFRSLATSYLFSSAFDRDKTKA